MTNFFHKLVTIFSVIKTFNESWNLAARPLSQNQYTHPFIEILHPIYLTQTFVTHSCGYMQRASFRA